MVRISDPRKLAEIAPAGGNARLVDSDESAELMRYSGEVGSGAAMCVDVLTPIHFNILEVLEIAI